MSAPAPIAGGATGAAMTPHPAPDPPDAGEGRRGTLVIEDRVVEKVAAHAVAQIDRAAGAPRQLLGVTVGAPDEDSAARVKARVDGSIATVEVALTVQWPTSVRDVATQTRLRIREDVRRITDVEVRQVDIDVVGMSAAERDQPRVR